MYKQCIFKGCCLVWFVVVGTFKGTDGAEFST